IQQAQLVAAFHAWTCEKARSLADHLVALGHLSPAQRSVVEALAALHVDAHGGHVEQSLAALPAGKSTRESLAGLGDPEVQATLGTWPPATARPRTATPTKPPATPSEPPPAKVSGSASSGPTPAADWAPSSSPSMRSCIARWC